MATSFASTGESQLAKPENLKESGEQKSLSFADVQAPSAPSNVANERAGLAAESAKLAKQGVIGGLELTDSSQVKVGGETNPQVQAVSNDFNGKIPAAKDSAEIFKNGVGTANALVDAKPEDRQKILDQSAGDFLQKNPGVETGFFTDVVDNALRKNPANQNPANQNLTASFEGNFAAVHDKTAVSKDNPNGIVAASFMGVGDKDIDTRDGIAFDTSKNVAASINQGVKDAQRDNNGQPVDADKFKAQVGDSLDTLRREGMFSPLNDTNARPFPADRTTFTDQFDKVRKDVPVNGVNDPDKLARQAVVFGNKLAFAEPSQVQQKFGEAMDTLRKDHPEVNQKELAFILANGARRASNSDDFNTSQLEDTVFFNNKRQANPNNPHGNVAAIAEEGRDVSKPALATALNAAAEIRKGAAALPENLKKDQIPNFNASVMDFLNRLPAQSL